MCMFVCACFGGVEMDAKNGYFIKLEIKIKTRKREEKEGKKRRFECCACRRFKHIMVISIGRNKQKNVLTIHFGWTKNR